MDCKALKVEIILLNTLTQYQFLDDFTASGYQKNIRKDNYFILFPPDNFFRRTYKKLDHH